MSLETILTQIKCIFFLKYFFILWENKTLYSFPVDPTYALLTLFWCLAFQYYAQCQVYCFLKGDLCIETLKSKGRRIKYKVMGLSILESSWSYQDDLEKSILQQYKLPLMGWGCAWNINFTHTFIFFNKNVQ